jgi:two-component system sensor histidine kinase/response regulator
VSPREVITEDDDAVTRIPRGDVLAWAALDLAEVPELDPSVFDVQLLLDEAERRFTPTAREKGLSLEVKRGPSLPAAALGEVDWLRAVLCGVIDNAVRFTDSGEVVASITADRTGGSRVLFHAEVSDTGCGMPADLVARLFGSRDRQRFTPLTGVAGGGGTLGVVNRLVELMDGRLGCSSALGMGTTMWFTVPLDLP